MDFDVDLAGVQARSSMTLPFLSFLPNVSFTYQAEASIFHMKSTQMSKKPETSYNGDQSQRAQMDWAYTSHVAASALIIMEGLANNNA